MTQGRVEQAIATACEALEEATEQYRDVSQRAAEAEADYKREQAYTMVAMIEHGSGRTAQERTARVEAHISDIRRAYLLADAERHAVRESLLSLRARLEALRTLSANIRAQT
jgi:hypothetical protein